MRHQKGVWKFLPTSYYVAVASVVISHLLLVLASYGIYGQSTSSVTSCPGVNSFLLIMAYFGGL